MDDLHDDMAQEPTESYQFHDFAGFIKLMFYGLIIWGLCYSAYYLFTGFDSEALFDQRAAAESQEK